MATAHLLHGFIGAGKTTLARRLEARHAAVTFTPDAWMAALFGPDPPAAQFARHAQTIKDQLHPTWSRLLRLGVDVVLDYGFWTRAERDEARRRVADAGAVSRLYRLHIPDADALTRVSLRNLADPAGLQIPPGAYEALRARFEPLDPDEAAEPGL